MSPHTPEPRRSGAGRGHARTVTGNSWRILDTSTARFNKRVQFLVAMIFLLLIAMILRLVWVQLIQGPSLSEQAQQQRTAVITDPAHRGDIVDRNGEVFAYTMEARSLSVHPTRLRDYMQERHELYPEEAAAPDERIEEIIDTLPEMINEDGDEIEKDDLRDKLTSKNTYEVLVRNVDPDIAEKVVEKFPEITSERQDLRQYPNGAVGQNVVGKISTDNQGQFGLELSQDSKLQGINGSRTVDVAGDGYLIPGSTRDQRPAVDGQQYQLTLDLNVQTYVQQQLQTAKEKSGAESASAVVMDAKTGEIISMASSDTINPNGDIEKQLDKKKVFGDRTTAESFEPGSVAKIMTAAAAIEEGKTTPDEVITVPGSIDMSGVTVKDAWEHGDIPFTTTGIFGKSSNVGTLMLAERVGEEKMYDYFRKFGIGQPVDLGLPYETAGFMPELSQWSGGTFANLPIGQGMSMNLVQMTSMFQAMANNGVRVAPKLIDSVTTPDGQEVPQPESQQTRVVSEQTAKTVVNMFRSVIQDDPTGVQQGSGTGAAIEGYQVSGKTGTAQQVDPDTGAYSNSNYWINFAGIAPADDPRFVIGISLDNPERGPDGGAGGTSAPLFHTLGTWLLDYYNVPLSGDPGAQLMLEAPQ